MGYSLDVDFHIYLVSSGSFGGVLKHFEDPTIQLKPLPESKLVLAILRMLYVKNIGIKSVFGLQGVSWDEVSCIPDVTVSRVMEMAEQGVISVVASNDLTRPVSDVQFANYLQYATLHLDQAASDISMSVYQYFLKTYVFFQPTTHTGFLFCVWMEVEHGGYFNVKCLRK